MTIVINSITRCIGGNHIEVTADVDGISRTVRLERDDLIIDPGDYLEAAIARIRSAVKEANATTPAQIQTALIGKTFKI